MRGIQSWATWGQYVRGRRQSVRALAVLLAITVMPCLGSATQFATVFETDVDQAAPNEVAWEGFSSLTSLMNNDWFDVFYSDLNINGTWSMGGFACDGHQYYVMLESDTDVPSNEVYYITYASLADLRDNVQGPTGYTSLNISPGWSMHGFASDGTRFYIFLESDTDAAAGSEIYVMRYTSFANVITSTEESTEFWQGGLQAGWSIADFATDGHKFYMMLETDADVSGVGNESWVARYASFTEFMNNNSEWYDYVQWDISSAWSMNGFAGEIPIFEDGFETGNYYLWDDWQN